ncbi:MAG TPA: TonB-dependent receptor [Steroidobacteraceae bacterium]|nr:TonB-dependent receptor [Steroidobacteraceae bacterium]
MFRPQNNIPAMFATLVLVAACPTLARAADDPASPDAAPEDEATSTHGPGSKSPGTSDTSNLPAVVVTAQRLNEARAGIQTQTGASTYTIDSAAIAATPGGDNTLLNQVILQAPGVVQDSFGQLHVRGDHNGLQYRLNGVILPEGINVFSQSFDAKLIQSLSLITGALPAEYGLRTAGIIDITTKSGIFDQHGNVSVYGGSHGDIEPSFFHGGSIDGLNYFVSGDFLRNDLGIESPDGRSDPLHDHTTQYHGFAYLEYLLGENDRLSAVLGTSHGKFQIPNVSGMQPSLGLTVNGQTDFPSELLNENQTEITHYGIVSWQHSVGHFNTQTSFSARYSSLTYTPDWLGELLYNGIAQAAFKRDVAYGFQNDSSYELTDDHTIRGGIYYQHDRATSRTNSQVLQTDADGNPLNDLPYTIIDNGEQSQMIESVYLQDEWKLLSTLTVNYGLRFDRYSAYSSGSQTSPRVNFVWKPIDGTTVHAGYSRYFSPPPFELVGSKDIALFQNTTSPPLNLQADSPFAERANYYDLGAEQKFLNELTVSVDAYYKQSVNLIDEGQFGAPIILTPFNYRHGQQYGAELALNYANGPFSAYGNLASARDIGKNIVSAQFNFDPDDLDYIVSHYIHLDHEQQITASGGISYLVFDTRFSADMLVGSGLRADLTLPDGSTIPNGAHLPYYTQVNFGVSHAFHIPGIDQGKDALTVRFDVINAFDRIYQIRNGTGVGVGASQYGPRRGFFAGVSMPF